MINVNVVDMCSSQRRLQRSRLYGGHIAYVLATGQLHQMGGDIKEKDMVLPMRKVQNLPKKKKIKVPCNKCNKTEAKEKYFPYCSAEHWSIAVRAEPE